jgi:hypothetical protein
VEIFTGKQDVRQAYHAFIAEANAQGLEGVINSVNAAFKK